MVHSVQVHEMCHCWHTAKTHLLLATVIQSYFVNEKDFSITPVPFTNGRRKNTSRAALLVSRIAASMQWHPFSLIRIAEHYGISILYGSTKAFAISIDLKYFPSTLTSLLTGCKAIIPVWSTWARFCVAIGIPATEPFFSIDSKVLPCFQPWYILYRPCIF